MDADQRKLKKKSWLCNNQEANEKSVETKSICIGQQERQKLHGPSRCDADASIVGLADLSGDEIPLARPT